METSFGFVSGRAYLDPAVCIYKHCEPPGGFLQSLLLMHSNSALFNLATDVAIFVGLCKKGAIVPNEHIC